MTSCVRWLACRSGELDRVHGALVSIKLVAYSVDSRTEIDKTPQTASKAWRARHRAEFDVDERPDSALISAFSESVGW